MIGGPTHLVCISLPAHSNNNFQNDDNSGDGPPIRMMRLDGGGGLTGDVIRQSRSPLTCLISPCLHMKDGDVHDNNFDNDHDLVEG